mmetsp:Transcript_52241/g.124577  ORF Transcript_52241/g.124577 Transcript_52241/m.124577 type:complete len:524 (-) Transcript_52241:266-1837(-)|eukprot:CAMPEP_0178417744 /NCGR_PEP_ID=MMETSP0689_2-20121128/24728_1 /TAXON_ID=160604 /ORGANISM="Amphidinium massartii, Strain CS-259" /LENGTH=523 /DNA_ID=CAMNT_0020039111 /DNA_START=31 /DNA_END=1605 /DNA_ORIENTATION=+
MAGSETPARNGNSAASADLRRLGKGNGRHHGKNHGESESDSEATAGSEGGTAAQAPTMPPATALSPGAAAAALKSTPGGGDVGIAILTSETDPLERLTVCSSDLTQPLRAGGCAAVEGPEPWKVGEPLSLGLQHSIAMAAVDANRTLLCHTVAEEAAPAVCEVLQLVENELSAEESGQLEVRSTKTVDMVVEVMSAKESRFVCCYVYELNTDSKLLNCDSILVSGSSVTQLSQLAFGNDDAETNPTNSVKLAQVDEDKVLVCWAKEQHTASCCLLTDSPAAPFQHSESYLLTDMKARSLTMAPVNENRVIVCFADGNDLGSGACNLVQSYPNSTDLLIGEPVVFTSSTNLLGSVALSSLSLDTAVLCYAQDSASESTVMCSLISAAGPSMSIVPLQEQTEEPGVQLSLSRLDNNRVFFCVKDAGDFPACRSLMVPSSVEQTTASPLEEKFEILPRMAEEANASGSAVLMLAASVMLIVALVAAVAGVRWLRVVSTGTSRRTRRSRSSSADVSEPTMDEEDALE